MEPLSPLAVVAQYCGGDMTAESARAVLEQHGANARSVVEEMAREHNLEVDWSLMPDIK